MWLDLCKSTKISNSKAYQDQDQDGIMWFLKGWNDQFSRVRSQILLINHVFALVVQQEQQFISENGEIPKALVASTSSANSALVNSVGVLSQPSARHKKSGKGKFVKRQHIAKSCSFCDKSVHTMETCFRKHGFPPYFKKGQGLTINNISFEDCDQEDETSHEESHPASNFSLTKE